MHPKVSGQIYQLLLQLASLPVKCSVDCNNDLFRELSGNEIYRMVCMNSDD